MKAIHNTILIILFISVASIASACHEGDFDSSGKGHHKFGKNIGILQFTENSTISVSTTTSCDFYTAFLDSEYDFILKHCESIMWNYSAIKEIHIH
jgi:hypothetical protein